MDYPARREVARRWMALAERQLRARQWWPTLVEREIAWDLARATRRPVRDLPPHTAEVLAWRLLSLAHCAPAVRLAMRAGGWSLPDDGVDPPGPDTQVTLPGLLAALYPTAAAAERWSDQCDVYYRTVAASADMDATVTAQMTATAPSIEEYTADLEQLWGAGGLGVLLFVVATGNVDD